MPYWREGDPKPGWMRRREWRERVSHRLFGHGVETMIGVVLIIIGGLFFGIAVVAIARDGWSFKRISAGLALGILPIWFGLFFLPKRNRR